LADLFKKSGILSKPLHFWDANGIKEKQKWEKTEFGQKLKGNQAKNKNI
jgi:hypothetical protein